MALAASRMSILQTRQTRGENRLVSLRSRPHFAINVKRDRLYREDRDQFHHLHTEILSETLFESHLFTTDMIEFQVLKYGVSRYHVIMVLEI